MRKFLISFTFRGFSYEARVHLRKINDVVHYDIDVLNTGLLNELENITLVFVDRGGFLDLALLEEGETYLTLWSVEATYISNSELCKDESFSLS